MLYEDIIHKSHYSRWDKETKHKEDWKETVTRYCENILLPHKNKIDKIFSYDLLSDMLLCKQVVPSMRMMLTAGEALDRDNAAGYNCAATPLDSIYTFSEVLYLFMCGTGVGVSVEDYNIAQLPPVPPTFTKVSKLITIEDDRIGWCTSLDTFINYLFRGEIPYIDYNNIRPKGMRLHTFGGRSSGYEVLKELFDFITEIMYSKAGTKLSSTDCGDILCKIAAIVQCGGVRRSALILLFTPGLEALEYKSSENLKNHKERSFANISIVNEKEEISLTPYWSNLYNNGTGEPGIYNRYNVWGKTGKKYCYLTNPCGEIIALFKQFCNLSETICRYDDTLDILIDKQKASTILGTIQATYTNLRYLRPEWKINTEAERNIGVSLTGIMDCPITQEPKEQVLKQLKETVYTTNKEMATLLGISPAARYTCIKPSGTVSQLVNCSSGIHNRYSKYYIRSMRLNEMEPINKVLKQSGVPNEPEIGSKTSDVFYFPIKTEGEVIETTAATQLYNYLIYNKVYATHSVSCTIYLEESEWDEMFILLKSNMKDITGITFYPRNNIQYEQPPYRKCSKDEYENFPKTENVDWKLLDKLESETDHEQEVLFQQGESACQGNSCEWK